MGDLPRGFVPSTLPCNSKVYILRTVIFKQQKDIFKIHNHTTFTIQNTTYKAHDVGTLDE